MPETLPQEQKPQEGVESRAEKEPRRVFIEIGAGDIPFSVFGQRKMGKSDVYVGIDVKESNIVSAKESTKHLPAKELGEGHHYFVQGDAKNLPLGDASADEVFIGNVFGDEMHISFEDRKKYLLEASRALGENGRLIIKETNTPLDREKLNQLLEGTDFSLDKIWNREANPEEFEAQRRLYEGEFDLSAPDSYIVILKKVSKQDAK